MRRVCGGVHRVWGWLLGDAMGKYVYVRALSSGQPVTATFGADGDEAPQRVRVDQRG